MTYWQIVLACHKFSKKRPEPVKHIGFNQRGFVTPVNFGAFKASALANAGCAGAGPGVVGIKS